MRSSRSLALALVLAATAVSARAEAQQAVNGFKVERLYPAPAGGGWFVMDALDWRGSLAGAMGLTQGYSHAPLRIGTSDGAQRLTIIQDQAFADFGFAVTLDRFRAYLDFDMPLYVRGGQGGAIGGYAWSAPGVDPGSNPDTLADARVGFDARLVGDARDAFRLGIGAQLYVPNGNRADYVTDGSYRAMGRVLVAGDVGAFTYAGHAGVHVRPLDDSPAPGSPQGSELLFGGAAGARLLLCNGGSALVIGPEVYGATAFASFFGTTGTALEGLFTGRWEGTREHGPQVRLKLGMGAGLNPHFGAPEWRTVLGVEVFDRGARARP